MKPRIVSLLFAALLVMILMPLSTSVRASAANSAQTWADGSAPPPPFPPPCCAP